jgi:DNA-binding beta-propeller fold protein YncE
MIALLAALALAGSPAGPPDRDYFMFVASEGNDRISLVRFGPTGARVERERRISLNPTELVGPHGLSVSPDGQWYYVTTAHGTPDGAMWKFSSADDHQAGMVTLGLFPATLQVAPGGHYAWTVNFNLYGDMVPSSVSVVWLDRMLEVKRIPTCVMPHGSRLSPDGRRHYSVCMMNDVLVEIDADRLAVSRHFMVAPGAEKGMDGPPSAMAMGNVSCSPRGLSPPPTAARSGSPATRPTTSWRSTSPRGRSGGGFRRERGSITWRRVPTGGCWSAPTRRARRCR